MEDKSRSVSSAVVLLVEESRERDREEPVERDRDRELARRDCGRGLGGASASSAMRYSTMTSSSIALAFDAFLDDFAVDLDLVLLSGCLFFEVRAEDLVPLGRYSRSEEEATGITGGGLDLDRTRRVDSEMTLGVVKNGQGFFLS